MKLITKSIASKLHNADLIVAQNGESSEDIIVKFFTPWANATWYITSGTPLDREGAPCEPSDAVDWHLFGYCNLGNPDMAELGYVMLSDLMTLRGPAGLQVERDLHFEGYRLSEIV